MVTLPQRRVPAQANVIFDGGPYDGWRLSVTADVLSVPLMLDGEEHVYSFGYHYRAVNGHTLAVFDYQGIQQPRPHATPQQPPRQQAPRQRERPASMA